MSARRRRAAAAYLAMLPWPARAAAEPDEAPAKVDEVIEELFLGEAVYPQDALELQVTGGLAGARASGATAAAAELELELGLTDRLQLAAEVPLVWRSAPAERQVGAGNPELELLYNPLSDRARGLAVSVGVGVMFPALSPAGEDAWGAEAFAVAYKVLGGIHVNLAVAAELELPTEEEDEEDEREVALAATLGVFAPIGRWVPVVELRAASGEAPVTVLSAGVLWHPAGEVEVGAALQLGLDTRSIGGILTATVELELAD